MSEIPSTPEERQQKFYEEPEEMQRTLKSLDRWSAEEEDIKREQKDIFRDIDIDGIHNIIKLGGDKEEGKYENESLRKIEEAISERFPRTYHITDDMKIGEFCDKLKNFYKENQAEQNLINEYVDKINANPQDKDRYMADYYHFHNKKYNAPDLYGIAAFLKGETLSEENPVDDLESQLKGKKILILGDDTGSLSEALNAFGAQAIGIEYDRIKVLTAHSGIFSESGTPQNQVFQGDIGDLTDKNSDLYKKLQDMGPFDVIYSNAVFNLGSGIEDAMQKYYKKIKGDSVIAYLDLAELYFCKAVTDNCMPLLSQNGFCLYNNIDYRGLDRYRHGSDLALVPKNRFKKWEVYD